MGKGVQSHRVIGQWWLTWREARPSAAPAPWWCCRGRGWPRCSCRWPWAAGARAGGGPTWSWTTPFAPLLLLLLVLVVVVAWARCQRSGSWRPLRSGLIRLLGRGPLSKEAIKKGSMSITQLYIGSTHINDTKNKCCEQHRLWVSF